MATGTFNISNHKIKQCLCLSDRAPLPFWNRKTIFGQKPQNSIVSPLNRHQSWSSSVTVPSYLTDGSPREERLSLGKGRVAAGLRSALVRFIINNKLVGCCQIMTLRSNKRRIARAGSEYPILFLLGKIGELSFLLWSLPGSSGHSEDILATRNCIRGTKNG